MSQAVNRSPLQISRAIHLWVWVAFGLLTLALVGLFLWGREINFWAGWQESRGLYRSSYTELVYVESIFRTRANTWSNLAYVLVGFYAIGLGLQDWRRAPGHGGNYLQRYWVMGVAFGVACALLGLASGIYHASLTRWGQQLDVACMYPPLMLMIAAGVGRLAPRLGKSGPPTWPLLLGVVIVVGGLLYYYKWQMSAVNVLVTLMLLIVALRCWEFFARAPLKSRWFHGAIALLAVGVFFRQIDVAGRFTGPEAWLQGHALWHGFTALSLGSIYFYYRSEVPTQNGNRD